jgi:aerobic carbon-monoxide dehydrogenase medium subunit
MTFEFHEPDSLAAALDGLAEHGDGAKVMAGGTALVLMLQQRLIAPQLIISLDRIAGLDEIRPENGGLHLGPLTPLREIERSPLVRRQYPMLAQACGEVGNVRVRNQATIGGNLAEADYASDPPAALLALAAQVRLQRRHDVRQLPLSEFFLGFYTTVLEADELITGIYVPPVAAHAKMTYLKYKSRSAEDRPCVGVAAVADMDGDICRHLAVAVGAACEVPTRLPQVEALARDAVLNDELIADIAAAYAAQVETLDDMRGSAWYRTQMIATHVRRALKEVFNGRR